MRTEALLLMMAFIFGFAIIMTSIMALIRQFLGAKVTHYRVRSKARIDPIGVLQDPEYQAMLYDAVMAEATRRKQQP